MRIYANFPESDGMTGYRMFSSDIAHKMGDLAEKGVQHAAHCLLVDDAVSSSGEVVERVSFEVDGQVYSTISKSFIRGFKEFMQFLSPTAEFDFRVILRETRAGRKCILFEGCGIMQKGGDDNG